MRVVIHYVDTQGAILVIENVEYPKGHASEQELQSFARVHLNSLNLSQRCASAIKQAHVYTVSTVALFE